MTYPTLDLTAISTAMAGFFGFVSPALWVAVGISLGGYIAAKVRGIL